LHTSQNEITNKPASPSQYPTSKTRAKTKGNAHKTMVSNSPIVKKILQRKSKKEEKKRYGSSS